MPKRSTSIDQLSLFGDPEPARKKDTYAEYLLGLNYRQSLLEQVVRDSRFLRDPTNCESDNQFFANRIEMYRGELERIGDWDGRLPPQDSDLVKSV